MTSTDNRTSCRSLVTRSWYGYIEEFGLAPFPADKYSFMAMLAKPSDEIGQYISTIYRANFTADDSGVGYGDWYLSIFNPTPFLLPSSAMPFSTADHPARVAAHFRLGDVLGGRDDGHLTLSDEDVPPGGEDVGEELGHDSFSFQRPTAPNPTAGNMTQSGLALTDLPEVTVDDRAASVIWLGTFGMNVSGPLALGLTIFTWICIPNSFHDAFSPIQILYSRPPDFGPALLAPFIPAQRFSGGLAHFIQLLILTLCVTPRSPRLSTPSGLFITWAVIVALRTLVAFIFSRAVGWAAPSLFNHNAAYEGCTGLGPIIVALGVATSIHLRHPLDSSPTLSGASAPPTTSARIMTLHAFVAVILCLLDGAPWTYGCGAIVGASIALGEAMLPRIHRAGNYQQIEEHSMPLHSLDDDVFEGTARRSTASMGGAPPSRLLLIRFATGRLIAQLLAALLAASLLRKSLSSIPRMSSLGETMSLERPIFDIVLLSSPRPQDNESASNILIDTISSYFSIIPPLSTRVSPPRISVFTHFDHQAHPAFKRAQSHFSSLSRPELGERASSIVFFRDEDQHPGTEPGHHLHLAELLRWSYERQGGSEWTMVVEDDFPVCGEWGWKGIEAVLARLELDRRAAAERQSASDAEHEPAALGAPLAGWVGAGGSGLILHRSILPVAEQLLRLYVVSDGKTLPNIVPADLVLQQCMSGEISLCGKEGIAISSRMLMGHTGAGNSAMGHDTPADRWLCRWR